MLLKKPRDLEIGKVDHIKLIRKTNLHFLKERAWSKARSAFDEVPEVRADKVTSLQKKLHSGTYEIPYDQLATTLLLRL
jgi:hypothetical protein